MTNAVKKARPIIIIMIIAVLAVSYYIYLSNKKVDNTEKLSDDTGIEAVLSRNMETGYPSDYYAVVDYFVSLQKVFYKNKLDDEQIARFADKMRSLFDDELLGKDGNQYDLYLEALKTEYKDYRENKRYVKDYQVQPRLLIETFTSDAKFYARVKVKYVEQYNGDVVTFYEKYTLRRDTSNKWKIICWERSDSEGFGGR